MTADVLQTDAGALQVKGLADMVRAKLANGGGEVPRIQPWRVGGGLGWTSDPVDLSFLLMYVGKRDKLAVGETPTKGYLSLDAHVDWRPLASRGDLTLILAAHNLTNSRQRDAIAINKDQVEQAGRDISFTVQKTF